MFGPIKAVAIDDEPGHLLSITTGLSSAGIPCIGYWYDGENSQLQPPPPEGGLPYLRLLITDLNLEELAGTPEVAKLWAVIVAMLNRVVSKESGPYALVFWTSVDGQAEQVIQMLYDRADQLAVPLPVRVIPIKKGAFLPAPPKAGQDFAAQLHEFYAGLVEKIDDLKKIISETVGVDPILNASSAWESRAAEAAAATINRVHRCAMGDAEGPKEVAQSMSKVLGRVAIAASGKKSAGAQPARALDAGLIDILIDQFGSTVDSEPFKASAAAAIGETIKNDIEFRNKEATFADLNSFFQVDQIVTGIETWDRGVVLPAKRPHFPPGLLGFNPTELIGTEFLYSPEMLFSVEGDAEGFAAAREHHRAVRHAGEVVLIELGADCDHAMDQNRTRRFLVGLELNKEHLYLAKGKDEKLRHGALELLGPWNINGSIKYLLISCRRFWTWQDVKPPNGEIRYRLRAPVVGKLLHRYSAWSSRPGIVEFRD